MNITPVQSIWLAWLITAVNLVVLKSSVDYITSVLYIWICCMGAFLLFVPILLKKGTLGSIFTREVWLKCLAMGTFGTALPVTVFIIALHYTSPTNEAVLNQTEIIYSIILSYIFLNERPNKRQLLGSAMIILGVCIIIMQNGMSMHIKGDLMIIGCVWMYQVSHVFSKKLPADMTPEAIAAARALYALPALTLLAVILQFFTPMVFVSNGTLWFSIVFGAVVNYFLGNIFWYHSIRNMDLSKATAIILSYPAGTFLLSVLLGQEQFTAVKVTGILIAMSGAYTITGVIKLKKFAKNFLP